MSAEQAGFDWNLPGMEVRPGAMGKPFPGHDVRVIDDGGRELPDPMSERGVTGDRCRKRGAIGHLSPTGHWSPVTGHALFLARSAVRPRR
jgi:acyl-coenzyme A synthetase/AMP-(fatty) acid ligase